MGSYPLRMGSDLAEITPRFQRERVTCNLQDERTAWRTEIVCNKSVTALCINLTAYPVRTPR